jgi:hypothetical protein
LICWAATARVCLKSFLPQTCYYCQRLVDTGQFRASNLELVCEGTFLPPPWNRELGMTCCGMYFSPGMREVSGSSSPLSDLPASASFSGWVLRLCEEGANQSRYPEQGIAGQAAVSRGEHHLPGRREILGAWSLCPGPYSDQPWLKLAADVGHRGEGTRRRIAELVAGRAS